VTVYVNSWYFVQGGYLLRIVSVSVGNVHVDDSCQKLCAAAWFSGSPQKIESRIHLKMWVVSGLVLSSAHEQLMGAGIGQNMS